MITRMGRRSVDWVNWRLYRHAWALVVLATIVLLATSFRPEEPAGSTLPPTFTNEQAQALVQRAREFDDLFPDRRPGTGGSLDAAQWMRGEFDHLGLRARIVPATTVSPRTNASVGVTNVEAVLRGRTDELVVVFAHRDNRGGSGAGGDGVGTVALLQLAEELAATTDRRRTYLFVSTDGATINGSGARALAGRLATRASSVVAVIGIDRIGADGSEGLHVPASPSGRHAPPLGLLAAARAAVEEEHGESQLPSVIEQLLGFGVPVTLREHGQVLARGLPAVTISGADERLVDDTATATPQRVGDGVRAVQRLLGTIDAVDQLQSAGKTYVVSERRVYRGWALKLLVASLLVPVWVVAVDMLVRHRRRWNLLAAVGTCARMMLASTWALAALWLITGLGWLPRTGDRPPNPAAIEGAPVAGLTLWAVVASAGWLLARGPDWRAAAAGPAAGRSAPRRVPDGGVLVVALLGGTVLAALMLAINPYAVIFALPALHAWPLLSSTHTQGRSRRTVAAWVLGLAGPLLVLAVIAQRFDAGASSAWYALALLGTRTVPPVLALLLGGLVALGLVQLIAARGRIAHPALPRLRHVLADPRLPAEIARRSVPRIGGALGTRRRRSRTAPVQAGRRLKSAARPRRSGKHEPLASARRSRSILPHASADECSGPRLEHDREAAREARELRRRRLERTPDPARRGMKSR